MYSIAILETHVYKRMVISNAHSSFCNLIIRHHLYIIINNTYNYKNEGITTTVSSNVLTLKSNGNFYN